MCMCFSLCVLFECIYKCFFMDSCLFLCMSLRFFNLSVCVFWFVSMFLCLCIFLRVRLFVFMLLCVSFSMCAFICVHVCLCVSVGACVSNKFCS